MKLKQQFFLNVAIWYSVNNFMKSLMAHEMYTIYYLFKV